MEFSEFAGLLYPIIGGGDTTGRFTRKLFEKITDIPVSKVDDNPLIDQSDETFKSYFNGTRAIRLLAKKINPYIDVTIFEAFIYSFDEVSCSTCAAPSQRSALGRLRKTSGSACLNYSRAFFCLP